MNAPVITTRTLWALDTDLLLASGAMEGPYTRPRPVLSLLYRIAQWWAQPQAGAVMSRLHEFLSVFRLYARSHSPLYAARIAWSVTVQRTPF